MRHERPELPRHEHDLDRLAHEHDEVEVAPLAEPERGLVLFGQALMNLNEFLYVD